MFSQYTHMFHNDIYDCFSYLGSRYNHNIRSLPYNCSQFKHANMNIISGNFEDEVKKTRETYETRTGLEVVTVLNSMGNATKILWRCDPTLHEEGIKYLQ